VEVYLGRGRVYRISTGEDDQSGRNEMENGRREGRRRWADWQGRGSPESRHEETVRAGTTGGCVLWICKVGQGRRELKVGREGSEKEGGREGGKGAQGGNLEEEIKSAPLGQDRDRARFRT